MDNKLCPGRAGLSRDTQEFRFKNICLHNPWYDSRITSLVHEEQTGKITGFIGIIPRSVTFKGARITIAVGQHLMVDRATLAALQLFKAFIAGHQEISMADMAADVTKKLWERLGGSTIYAHSTFWRKPLRPVIAAVSYIKRNSDFSAPASLLLPIASGIASMLNRETISQVYIARPASRGEELTI